MAYLNVDCDYFDHPKVRRLIGLLGKGSEVMPLRLWAYCGKFHPGDGRLTGYSAQEIESCIGWWGQPEALVSALEKVGFIERDDAGYHVHDWIEHQGHIVAFREKGKALAEARWAKARNTHSIAASNAHSNALTKPNLPNQPTHLAGEGGVVGEAEQNPDSQARCWIQANYPKYNRKFTTLSRLIVQLGREEAITRVEHAIAAGKTADPFAYVESVVVSEQAKQTISQPPPGKSVTKVIIRGEV